MRLIFESSYKCNLKCSYCPGLRVTRPKGEMSDELFHHIISEGKKNNIKQYSPYLYGDPFAFDRIYEWLDYMEEQGVKVNLSTNGGLMDVDRVLKYKCLNGINCSDNGVDAYEKNIRKLLDNADFYVRISRVFLDTDIEKQKAFKKKWGHRSKVSTYRANDYFDDPKQKEGVVRVPCYAFSKHTCILWDGRVSMCCLDYNGEVILGDITKQSLAEIIKIAKPLRKRHMNLDFDMPLCKTCNANVK